jgi:polygalacturonase
VPIAISPYYNNGTTDQFFDPGFKGTKIPEYKNITIENVTDLSPGDILIAGYDQAHRTQVDFKNVHIHGLTPDKLHLKFADIGVAATDIPFAKATDKADVKLNETSSSAVPYSCAGKFLPMR